MTNFNSARVIAPEYAKYEDSEFSDIEIEAFMLYFKVNTYDRLKSILLAMKKGKW